MKIKRSLLIRILKKLEDCSNWCEAHTLCDALGTKKEGESLFAHAVHLIQMGHVEERKNQWVIREWRITPLGREYLKELLTPEVGFRED